MSEVTAALSDETSNDWEAAIRALDPSRPAAPSPGLESFEPFHAVASATSDTDDAIGLVKRGVRLAPFAETTPLLPLYAALGQPVPAHLLVASEEQGYEFLLVELTFSLRLEEGESPDMAEFVVQIRDNVEGARATRAIEVFPQRVHADLFQVSGEVSVGLEASLKFEVEADPARAAADAGIKTKVIAGPFRIGIGQTQLDVSGEGDRSIGWTYRVRKALEGKNDFKSFLVLKVARETKKVALDAKIGVRTYRRSWRTLGLRETLPILYAKAKLDVELPAPRARGR